MILAYLKESEGHNVNNMDSSMEKKKSGFKSKVNVYLII